MKEIQSIKIHNFSLSQCDSLSGLYVQRENPSLKCLFCLHALIYISHCGWKEVQYSSWQIYDTHCSWLHFKNRISQLISPSKRSQF